MSETQSLLEQVIQKRDSDESFVVYEQITDQLATLHQILTSAFVAKGLEEDVAERAAHELLQLDSEYNHLIGGTSSREEIDDMRQRLIEQIGAAALEDFKRDARGSFENILEGIMKLEV